MNETKKQKRVTPTFKQKKLALAVIENMKADKPVTKMQLLENVGYSPNEKTPSRVLESRGYLQALRDLGLTEELVTLALVEDINNKPKNRVKELSLASDILQMRKPVSEVEKNTTIGNTYNFLFSPEVQADIYKIEQLIKNRLKSNNK